MGCQMSFSRDRGSAQPRGPMAPKAPMDPVAPAVAPLPQPQGLRLDDLPVEITSLILQHIDCISDLIKATHSCPALFRTFKSFETQICYAVLNRQFSPEELYPLHMAVSLPKQDVYDYDHFITALSTLIPEDRDLSKKLKEVLEENRAISRLSWDKPAGRKINPAKQIAAIRATSTLSLCRAIDRFHGAQTRLSERYFREGLVPIPRDNEGIASDTTFTNSDGDVVEPPTRSERLRFLQAVCNMEILRRLTVCKYPAWDPDLNFDRVSWARCSMAMRCIFSFHDSLQMQSIEHFIRARLRPCELRKNQSRSSRQNID